MSEIQTFLTELLSGLAAALPFGLAFGAGMVAAVNPCGFAMLPAYLSLYLGTEESGFAERSAMSRALRALAVGCVVSSGFVLLFVMAGAVISAGGTALIGVMPVLGVLVGEALVVLGVWMLLAGRAPYAVVLGRLATRLGDPRKVGVRGFFLFGLAYGAASLGCTLPAFLAVGGRRHRRRRRGGGSGAVPRLQVGDGRGAGDAHRDTCLLQGRTSKVAPWDAALRADGFGTPTDPGWILRGLLLVDGPERRFPLS